MCPVTDLNALEKNVPILSVEHLKKNFGEHEVLRDITFDVPQGDVVSIIGSSGSGKSTLLRCINFLEEPTDGRILFRERTPKPNGLGRSIIPRWVWCFRASTCSTT